MTPEEKAKELVEKMHHADELPSGKMSIGFVDIEIAKHCALISVDEILAAYDNCSAKDSIHFYQKVKESINKL